MEPRGDAHDVDVAGVMNVTTQINKYTKHSAFPDEGNDEIQSKTSAGRHDNQAYHYKLSDTICGKYKYIYVRTMMC